MVRRKVNKSKNIPILWIILAIIVVILLFSLIVKFINKKGTVDELEGALGSLPPVGGSSDPVPTSGISCEDSDEGVNHDVSGNVKIYKDGELITSQDDYCIGTKSIDKTCEGTNVKNNQLDCSVQGKTCSNGACV
jgi:hypothetical protein